MATPLIAMPSMRHQADLVVGAPRYSCFVAERQYAEMVAEAGGSAVILPLLGDPPDLARFDGLLLPGGGDVDPRLYGGDPGAAAHVDPELDAFEVALLRQAWELSLPSLGICRGMQVLNVARGGDLYVDLASAGLGGHHIDIAHDTVHPVSVKPDSLLARVLGGSEVRLGAPVTSGHHQGVRRLGEGLVPVAWSTPPGEGDLVEAVEAEDRPVLGVQWHPDAPGPGLRDLTFFRGFVALAAKGRR